MKIKTPQNIDELLEVINELSSEFEKMIKETDGDKKLADILVNANDLDSRFKARMLMMIITEMERVKIVQDHLLKPVSLEGIMNRETDGKVCIDDAPVSEGEIVEFMSHGEWDAGKLVIDPVTKNAKIVDLLNAEKTKIDKINDIKARIR